MEIKVANIRETRALHHLRHLSQSPHVLFSKGTLPEDLGLTVAIVGSRKPTAYGKEVTFKLAYELATRGVTIISGLAYGVDAVAHTAALEAGGRTIAVLAHGLDRVYPAAHRPLAEKIIASGGALLSEYPPGTPPRQHHFLARNRLISGLADAVIVTEAAERSGALSTVTHALDQNKEVFAVPGPITSPLSVGPNRLIQQGAHPVLGYESVLEVIAPQALEEQQVQLSPRSPLEKTILELLENGIRDGDRLLKESGNEAGEFFQTMIELELEGYVRSVGGNQWSLCK